MTLSCLIVDLVNERGRACVDDLLPELEDYSRAQVIRALQRAAFLDRIVSEGYAGARTGPGTKGAKPTYYRALPPKPEPVYRRVASVFHLAAL